MQPADLYPRFDELFIEVVLPYLEHHLPRNTYAQPIYYYIDKFPMRRFRSGLPLLIAHHLGVSRDIILPIATASELAFYAALVLDDILDRDRLRGAIPAAHLRFGVKVSFASAEYASAAAMIMLNDLNGSSLRCTTIAGITEGFRDAQRRLYRSFLQESLTAFDPTVTRQDVIRLQLDKTVHGINALTCTGMVVDDAPDGPTVRFFRSYAELLAQAGQTKNDIYDIERYAPTRGYSDFRNGYINYIISELFQMQRPTVDTIVRLLRKRRYADVIHYAYDLGIMRRAERHVSRLVERALRLVAASGMPHPLKQILSTWAEGNRQKSVRMSHTTPTNARKGAHHAKR